MVAGTSPPQDGMPELVPRAVRFDHVLSAQQGQESNAKAKEAGELLNYHPLVVHYPIALLLAAFALELLGLIFGKDSLHTAARWNLYLGTLGAIAALLTGLNAGESVPHSDAVHEIMERHETLGKITVLLALLVSIWRLARPKLSTGLAKGVSVVALAIIAAVISYGAYFGGEMVYRHGVGGTAVPQSATHAHAAGAEEHEHPAASARPEQPAPPVAASPAPPSQNSASEAESEERSHREGHDDPHSH